MTESVICAACGVSSEDRPFVHDHIVACWRHGHSTSVRCTWCDRDENMQWLCAPCEEVKSRRDRAEFWQQPESRAKQSLALQGNRNWSRRGESTRQKQRQWNLGRKMSAEARERMSTARKLWWESRRVNV